MPETKNNFIKAKMNQDLDDRLVPTGEYRVGQNVTINRSEGDGVGTFQNILGNESIYSIFNLTDVENLEVIVSENNNDLVKFEGLIDRHINKLCLEGKCGIICGKALGVKDKENKVILVEHLLNNTPLNLCMCSLSCIVLPDDEILKRHKYNWFVRMSHRQVLGGEFQASKFMILSLGK